MDESSEKHSGSAIPSQHTPGPWTYDPEFGEVVAGHREVAVPPTTMTVVAENIVAESVLRNNGHLIAAAPDLLAVLKKTVKWFGPDDETRLTLAAVEAAIAKAEGLEP